MNWAEATMIIETGLIWEDVKRREAMKMIPTVWDDDDYPTAGQMMHGMHQPVDDAPPPEKKPEPLPSFHNRPRVYKRDGTFEEK